MAIQKMTFSLDTLTAARIGALSEQLGKAKSAVVREAVALYKEHSDRVSETERAERVRVFREFLQQVPRHRRTRPPGRNFGKSSLPAVAADGALRPVMIVLDTSILIDALTEARPLAGALERLLDSGEPGLGADSRALRMAAGPQEAEGLEVQRFLFPDERAIVFGPAEARVAADLYRILPRARGRETEFAIAACALTQEGRLWTTNEQDFRDIPGLSLFDGTDP